MSTSLRRPAAAHDLQSSARDRVGGSRPFSRLHGPGEQGRDDGSRHPGAVPFSVVIPLFQKGAYIARAIQSVLDQTHQAFEVIVVDDGSKDIGPAVVAGFDDPRIRLIRQRNCGPGIARNRGIAEARHDLIALLDADDLFLPDHLEELALLHAMAPQAGLLSTKRLEISDAAYRRADPILPGPPHERRLYDYFGEWRVGCGLICCSSVALLRPAVDAVDGFSPMLIGEDRNLWIRLALSTPIAVSTKTTAIYLREIGGAIDTHQRQIVESRGAVVPETLAAVLAPLNEARRDPAHQATWPSMDSFLVAELTRALRQIVYHENFRSARDLMALYPSVSSPTLGAARWALMLPDGLLTGGIRGLKAARSALRSITGRHPERRAAERPEPFEPVPAPKFGPQSWPIPVPGPAPPGAAPKISVVVPLYNKAAFVRRALDSLLAQTVQDFEVVVVDDGSSDEGPAIVRAMTDPRIRLVTQENQGAGPARNRGVAEARSDLVAFLDADDLHLRNHLAELLALAKRFPKAGVVSARRYQLSEQTLREKGPPLPDEGAVRRRIYDYFGEWRVGCGYVHTSCLAVRKPVFQSLGGFGPLGVGEDIHLWIRMALVGEVAVSNRMTAVYVTGTGGAIDNHVDVIKQSGGAHVREHKVAVLEPLLRARSDPRHSEQVDGFDGFIEADVMSTLRRILYYENVGEARRLMAAVAVPGSLSMRLARRAMHLPSPALKAALRVLKGVRGLMRSTDPAIPPRHGR